MDRVRKNWFGYLLVVLMAVQVIFIAYVNLHDSKTIVNYDDANVMLHAREMWENKSFRVDNWVETTTMELDCATLLALPIYGITNDIFLAFALSNMIMVIVYILAIYGIITGFGYSWKSAFLAIDMLLIPYSVGMIEYFQMLFYHGAQYSIKIVIPLLVVLLLTQYRKQKRFGKVILCIWLLTGILAFVSGYSSGIYVLMCGVFPILACLILDYVQSYEYKKIDKGYFILVGGITICSAAGYLVNKAQSAVDYGGNLRLTSRQYMDMNARACLWGFFDVLHSLPNYNEAVKVLSAEGVTYICKTVIVLLLLAVVLANVKKIFEVNGEIKLQKYIAFLFVWNLFVLLFCDSRYALTNENIEYRYYLLPFVFAMILAAVQMEEWTKDMNVAYRNCIQGVAVLILAIVTIGCQQNIRTSVKEGYSDTVAICEAIQSLDVESVYFLCDKDLQGTARLIDSEHTYCGYDKDSYKLVVYDYYRTTTDRESHKDKNALVLYINETPDMYLPSYIASCYTKALTVGWYDIWCATENRLDGMSGLPIAPNKVSVDYFYSEGYGYDAENAFINENGELELLGTGEYIVQSPELRIVSDIYSITLEYDCLWENGNSVIGYIDIIENGKIAGREEITSKNTQLIMEDVVLSDKAVIGIAINEGVGCTLKSISYEEK